ncbi:MAG TPA: TIGR03435 family protein [Bryobacteraceae bacterium]|nr:TIGR03435 family protein [Bryobacteraceae bacterium]
MMVHRRLSLWAASPILLAASLSAQTTAAPSFEVATIKPAPPMDRARLAAGQVHVGLRTDAGRVDIGFFSLADLIRTAYRIKPYQLSGPEWLSSQRWDVAATIPPGAKAEQVPEMLQALLAERFKLSVHRTAAEHAIYALVANKNGLKLKAAEPDAPAPAASDQAPDAHGGGADAGENQVRITQSEGGRGATVSSPKFGQMKVSNGEGGAMRMEFSKMSMSDLADMLSQFVERPVLDMTGLSGRYQVALDLSMEDLMTAARAAGMGAAMGRAPGADASRAPADAASTPTSSIFTAIQQLGLKLEPRRASVDMIVVDHAEKAPTEN